MSAQHTPGPYPGAYHNESPEMWRRHFVADVVAARSSHRTALLFLRKGYAAEFVAQARLLRDAQLASARNSLLAYRAAIAKTTGSAS